MLRRCWNYFTGSSAGVEHVFKTRVLPGEMDVQNVTTADQAVAPEMGGDQYVTSLTKRSGEEVSSGDVNLGERVFDGVKERERDFCEDHFSSVPLGDGEGSHTRRDASERPEMGPGALRDGDKSRERSWDATEEKEEIVSFLGKKGGVAGPLGSQPPFTGQGVAVGGSGSSVKGFTADLRDKGKDEMDSFSPPPGGEDRESFLPAPGGVGRYNLAQRSMIDQARGVEGGCSPLQRGAREDARPFSSAEMVEVPATPLGQRGTLDGLSRGAREERVRALHHAMPQSPFVRVGRDGVFSGDSGRCDAASSDGMRVGMTPVVEVDELRFGSLSIRPVFGTFKLKELLPHKLERPKLRFDGLGIFPLQDLTVVLSEWLAMVKRFGFTPETAWLFLSENLVGLPRDLAFQCSSWSDGVTVLLHTYGSEGEREKLRGGVIRMHQRSGEGLFDFCERLRRGSDLFVDEFTSKLLFQVALDNLDSAWCARNPSLLSRAGAFQGAESPFAELYAFAQREAVSEVVPGGRVHVQSRDVQSAGGSERRGGRYGGGQSNGHGGGRGKPGGFDRGGRGKSSGGGAMSQPKENKPQTRASSGDGSREGVSCFNCRELGHYAWECPRKSGDRSKGESGGGRGSGGGAGRGGGGSGPPRGRGRGRGGRTKHVLGEDTGQETSADIEGVLLIVPVLPSMEPLCLQSDDAAGGAHVLALQDAIRLDLEILPTDQTRRSLTGHELDVRGRAVVPLWWGDRIIYEDFLVVANVDDNQSLLYPPCLLKYGDNVTIDRGQGRGREKYVLGGLDFMWSATEQAYLPAALDMGAVFAEDVEPIEVDSVDDDFIVGSVSGLVGGGTRAQRCEGCASGGDSGRCKGCESRSPATQGVVMEEVKGRKVTWAEMVEAEEERVARETEMGLQRDAVLDDELRVERQRVATTVKAVLRPKAVKDMDSVELEELRSEMLAEQLGLVQSIMSRAFPGRSDWTAGQLDSLEGLLVRVAENNVTVRLAGPRDRGHLNFDIRLKDGETGVFQARRRMNERQDKASVEWIQELERFGYLEKVLSPEEDCSCIQNLTHPQQKGKTRVCLDATSLNDITKSDQSGVESVEEVIARSNPRAKVFIVGDFTQGFYSSMATTETAKKMCFHGPPSLPGIYRLLVMAFGPMNAPSHFRKIADAYVGDIEDLLKYVDDMLAEGTDVDSLLAIFGILVERLEQHALQLNLSKFQVGNEVKFVGWVRNADGFVADPEKVQAIRELRDPSSRSELKSVLGGLRFLQKAVKGLGETLGPLNRLTSEKTPFVWTKQDSMVLERAKELVCDYIIRAVPDYNETFVIRPDFSDKGVGGFLYQGKGSQMKVIMVWSKAFAPGSTWAPVEGEAFAVRYALEQCYDYVSGKHFEIETDHRPLLWLLRQISKRTSTAKVYRWAVYLTQFDMVMRHVEGSKMRLADSLSRAPFLPSGGEAKPRNPRDGDGEQGHVKVLRGRDALERRVHEAHIMDGVHQKPTRVTEALWARRDREELLAGVKKAELARVVRDVCARCDFCQERSAATPRVAPLLPPPVPDWVGDTWSLDLKDVSSQPFKRINHILVMVEHLAKQVVLVGVRSRTEEDLMHAVKVGLLLPIRPRTVIMDLESAFAGAAFEKMLKEFNVVPHFTTPDYHSTNGAVERMIKEVDKSLGNLDWNSLSPEDREDDVILATIASHISYYVSKEVGFAPAEIFYGRARSVVEDTWAEKARSDRESKLTMAREERIRSKEKMKLRFDEAHDAAEREVFQPGDEVYLEVRNPNKMAPKKEPAIVRDADERHVELETEDGRVLRRHVNQVTEKVQRERLNGTLKKAFWNLMELDLEKVKSRTTLKNLHKDLPMLPSESSARLEDVTSFEISGGKLYLSVVWEGQERKKWPAPIECKVGRGVVIQLAALKRFAEEHLELFDDFESYVGDESLRGSTGVRPGEM